MENENLNFDAEIDRSEFATLKFDGEMMQSIFGDKDLWPSWVATESGRESMLGYRLNCVKCDQDLAVDNK